MSRYHELTEKIINEPGIFAGSWNWKIDSIIRSYLENKAEVITKMLRDHLKNNHMDAIVMSSFGLSSGVSEQVATGGNSGNFGPIAPEKPKQEEWCEHIYGEIGKKTIPYNFCPICGTPRPQEKVCESCKRPL